MLNEDGLLLVAVLAACGLVVLGALELVWPTRSTSAPRHGRHIHARGAGGGGGRGGIL